MTAPTITPMWRQSHVYPAPTLDAFDRPVQPWVPTSTVIEEIGSLTVFIDGVERMYERDVPAVIESWSSQKPFGDYSARIRFPQYSSFAPRPAWLKAGANLDIKLKSPDGLSHTTLWEGMPVAFECASGPNGGVTVDCLGALRQVAFYVRSPGTSDTLVDIGTLIANNYLHAFRPHLRPAEMAIVATGITRRYRGNWESALDYIVRLLNAAISATGRQWTVRHDVGRIPVLTLQDLTTEHWTVTIGTDGVQHRLQAENITADNVIYGEGTDVGGSRWRRLFPDQPAGYPLFQPLAYDTAVHGYDENVAGNLVDNTGRIDTTKLRVESFMNFGEGFNLAEAIEFAERSRLRGQDPGWLGEVSLGCDPQEDTRLKMRAIQNLRAKAYQSGAGILTHMAGVEHRRVGPGQYRTTCQVDTSGRDFDLLEAIKEQRKDLAKDPARSLLVGKGSALRKDEQIPWNDKAGSGVVPNDATWGHRHKDGTSVVACPADAWRVVKFLASERDTVISTLVQLSVARPFHVSFYDRFIATGDLPSNPFAPGAWNTKPAGFWYGVGDDDERAGFYPGVESEGAAVTGKFLDQNTWQYNHDDPDADVKDSLWMAIWVVGGTANMYAKLRRGVGY